MAVTIKNSKVKFKIKLVDNYDKIVGLINNLDLLKRKVLIRENFTMKVTNFV